MRTRWISALAGIPIFLGFCLWGREPFGLAVAVVAGLALYELTTAWRAEGVHANLLLLAIGVVAPIYAWTNWLDAGHASRWTDSVRLEALLFVGGMALLIAAVAEVLRASATGEMHVARNLGYGLFGGAYLALFFGLTWLRADPAIVKHGLFPQLENGTARTLLTVCCVWATDSFALFAGRALGRHKLAPRLSPAKTWEGAIGGLAAAVGFGLLFGFVFLGNPIVGAIVGGLAGTFGQAGDLFESALKREIGIKDFGAIMPGHGGVLDRFDSLLFVAPVAGLFFSILSK